MGRALRIGIRRYGYAGGLGRDLHALREAQREDAGGVRKASGDCREEEGRG